MLFTAGWIVSAWFFADTIFSMISGPSAGLEIQFEMFSSRVPLFGGFTVAQTTLYSYMITGIVLLLSLMFRFFCYPKFKDEPRGLQNAVESAIEAVQSFTDNATGGLGDVLPSYMAALAIFMIGSATTELFGLRAPTSDLLITFSMALITFFLVNYYGIKKKNIIGRIKSFGHPTPLVAPFKIISDIATPVSLACRLFGNTLGGMIVLELLKSALRGYAVGIPAVAGLYFNLFHPLIQAYIFVILSLTFITEATE